MKKILLIENEQLDFEAIKKRINEVYGDEVSVSPKYFDSTQNSYDYSGYLIGRLRQNVNNFEEILKHYNDIDLFIIDISLTGSNDNTGITFSKYIIENYSNFNTNRFNYNIIIISQIQHGNEITGENVGYLSKMNSGSHFPADLVEKIQKIFPISQQTNSNNTSSNTVPKQAAEVEFNKFTFLLHKGWKYLYENLNRSLDKLILFVFFILLLATIVYAGWNIVNDIVESIKEIYNTKGFKDKDSQILKTSEHIFIYLLPLFIVFGFFNYYKNNTRYFLLEGTTNPIAEENSTKAMNLAKLLFISSIISYILIKIIEEIFIKGIGDFVRLISFASLLVILMIYFLFLDRKKG